MIASIASIIGNMNQVVAAPKIRRQPICSYCKNPGHNVSRCGRLQEQSQEFEAICSANLNTSVYDFRVWLGANYRDDRDFLRAFVLRKYSNLHRTAPMSFNFCVDYVTNYMFETYRPDIYRIHLANHWAKWETANAKKFAISSTIETIQSSATCIVNKECNICWNETDDTNFVKFGCDHEFCKECVTNSFKQEQKEYPCCALCRAEVKFIKVRTQQVKDELAPLFM